MLVWTSSPHVGVEKYCSLMDPRNMGIFSLQDLLTKAQLQELMTFLVDFSLNIYSTKKETVVLNLQAQR